MRLVADLEDRIEDLTVLHSSRLQLTVSSQSDEIKRLRHTLDNKSNQLLESQRSGHQLQIRLLAARQHNHQLQSRIRELEKALEADDFPAPKLDSHNSNLPPSLDLPWNKPKRTRSLRQTLGQQVGGQRGHRGTTLRQVANPDRMIIHQAETCHHCALSLADDALKSFRKRQIF